MANLIAKTASDGALPQTIGAWTLDEVVIDSAFSVMPYAGQDKPVSAALKDAFGVALPNAGRSNNKAGVSALWFGRGACLVIGADPRGALGDMAAVTDQSDAWVIVSLSGADCEAVLARLVPVDLRAATFKKGHVAKSMLAHLSVTIMRTGPQAFQIMAMRSMTVTLIHDLTVAMRGVAAR